MWSDLRNAYAKDPALRGIHALEVVLYPGVWAIWAHRVAHALWRAGLPVIPRLVQVAARAVTGIEIHPGAHIGHRVFIDHGAGVVIGETAVVGDDTMMYHGVTLGGRGWWADPKGADRHPKVGRNVVLGAGATVLGPVTIGDDCRIGANALVLDDVPARSVVVAPRGRVVMTDGVPVEPDRAREQDAPAWLTNYEMGAL
ncbi:MAG TPA: serine O-acetyltransferase EpsC [Acidimicrobiales bacterium]|nr:serine O-acetyltransferase EpsC [Acidimicrobiales bacterium]